MELFDVALWLLYFRLTSYVVALSMKRGKNNDEPSKVAETVFLDID